MGIFSNETEEEKNYKKLIRAVRSSNLNTEWKDLLTDYISKINNGEIINDFVNQDYLNRAMLKLLDWDNLNEQDSKSTFRRIINILKQLIPVGEQTQDFEMMMEMFINNFCGNEGFIDNNMVDFKFYALFQNRYDYLYIMNFIASSEFFTDNFGLIASYAVDVSPYCANQQILKSEILAFMNCIESEYGPKEELRARMLDEAKKRCGVYPLDERELAKLSSEAEKAQALINKLENLRKSVDSFQDKIKTSTAIGKKELANELTRIKKEIIDLGASATSSMNDLMSQAKQDVIAELNKHVTDLETSLQSKSDKVFNKVLENSQLKIAELKRAAELVSNSTTQELLRIQGVSEESVNKLRQYVEDEPKLQELLKGAVEDNQVKETLLALKASGLLSPTQNTVVQSTASQPVVKESEEVKQVNAVEQQVPSVIIPGYSRIVSPADPSVIIPTSGLERTIIPAFDESIPFDKRMDRILKIKAARQANGEIFHEKTDEIISCLLEGDWPYLWGPSGCGKSYSIKQIAKLIGIDMVDNGKITDKYSIMAYNDPQGRFRATQAFVALVYGKLLSLDEFDNGNPDTQVVLNELYSGLLDTLEKPDELRYVTFAEDMRVPIHPNFRMISAGNTSGGGEDEAFSSRGKIDESVQQRMTPKRFWYDNRVEERIFGEYKAWYNIFVNFRKACDEYAKRQGLSTPIGVVTTRDASAIVKYIGHNSKSIDQILDEKFVQTKSEDYLQFIVNEFSDMYDLRYDDSTPKNPKNLSSAREKDIAKRLVLRCKKNSSGE